MALEIQTALYTCPLNNVLYYPLSKFVTLCTKQDFEPRLMYKQGVLRTGLCTEYRALEPSIPNQRRHARHPPIPDNHLQDHPCH